MKKIVIGITGASGAEYALRLLEALDGVAETHLVISKHGKEIIELESETSIKDAYRMASFHYEDDNFMAPIASGSYKFDAMAIVPCSMKTLSSVACGYADTLIGRTADVCLKEKRKLILVTREMPLNLIHLENMVRVTQAGGVIMPACPGFYNEPKTVDDLVNNVTGRILDLLEIDNHLFRRWGEPKKTGPRRPMIKP